MKKREEEEIQDEQQTLLQEKRKYPTVYKWKVAALVIAILCLIFLVIDIVLVVYVGNHQPRKINYTFVADLIQNIKDTAITPTQFANMMVALTTSYQDIWFQQAKSIDSWSSLDTSDLSLSRVVDFFTTKVENRMTFITFDLADKTSLVVGAFTHVPFKVPNAWSQYLSDNNTQYFTFQIDDRQSSLVGGNSESYLKMDGSDQNLINCKVISLSKTSFNLLEGVDITLQSAVQNSPYLRFLELGEINAKCFNNGQSGDFLGKLKQVVGNIDSKTQYKIKKIDTFQLSSG